MGKPKHDLSGMKYGFLTVLSYAYTGKNRKTFFLCKCECGKEKAVESSHLKDGHTTSCGCKKITQRTHGCSKTRLYTIWRGLMQRCRNKNNKGYKNYGGKGIDVCVDWNSFVAFREWALCNGYTDSLTLDRINNFGNYEPSNCRWATMKEQQNNRTNNIHLAAYDKILTIAEWSRITGLAYETIWNRIFGRGWSPERALTTPKYEIETNKKASV